MVTSDGRSFRYCLAGATALVVGNLQQAQAEATDSQNLAVAAAAIGDLSIVTTTTLTVTANEFAGGWAVISVTPGVGYQYRIRSHPAVTAAALTLTLEDPIQVALTTGSRVDLVHNPYRSIIVQPTTVTSSTVGVAVNNITAAQYGWLQNGGVGVCLTDGATSVGQQVTNSGTIAGAVIDAASTTRAIVGCAVTGIADTEYGAILLNLP